MFPASNELIDSQSLSDYYPDKPEEACGVFGLYAPEEEVAKLTYFGLYALQHRGQESAGIATFDGDVVHCHKDMGLVSQVFQESILNELVGTVAVGHTRYSTTGSSHRVNAQPAVLPTRLGSLAWPTTVIWSIPTNYGRLWRNGAVKTLSPLRIRK